MYSVSAFQDFNLFLVALSIRISRLGVAYVFVVLGLLLKSVEVKSKPVMLIFNKLNPLAFFIASICLSCPAYAFANSLNYPHQNQDLTITSVLNEHTTNKYELTEFIFQDILALLCPATAPFVMDLDQYLQNVTNRNFTVVEQLQHPLLKDFDKLELTKSFILSQDSNNFKRALVDHHIEKHFQYLLSHDDRYDGSLLAFLLILRTFNLDLEQDIYITSHRDLGYKTRFLDYSFADIFYKFTHKEVDANSDSGFEQLEMIAQDKYHLFSVVFDDPKYRQLASLMTGLSYYYGKDVKQNFAKASFFLDFTTIDKLLQKDPELSSLFYKDPALTKKHHANLMVEISEVEKERKNQEILGQSKKKQEVISVSTNNLDHANLDQDEYIDQEATKRVLSFKKPQDKIKPLPAETFNYKFLNRHSSDNLTLDANGNFKEHFSGRELITSSKHWAKALVSQKVDLTAITNFDNLVQGLYLFVRAQDYLEQNKLQLAWSLINKAHELGVPDLNYILVLLARKMHKPQYLIDQLIVSGIKDNESSCMADRMFSIKSLALKQEPNEPFYQEYTALLNAAVRLNNADALYEGVLYLSENKQDYQKLDTAIGILRRAYLLDQKEAMFEIGTFLSLNQLHILQKFSKQHASEQAQDIFNRYRLFLEDLAQLGSKRALRLLGELYLESNHTLGKLVKQDNKRALDYFYRASKSGDDYAKAEWAWLCFNLNLNHSPKIFTNPPSSQDSEAFLSVYTPKGRLESQKQDSIDFTNMNLDAKYAFCELQNLAQKDYAPASYYLYLIYSKGLGVKLDLKQALIYLEQAANLGHPRAILDLSERLIEGRGFEVDLERALSLLQPVLKNNCNAWFLMGSALLKQERPIFAMYYFNEYIKKALFKDQNSMRRVLMLMRQYHKVSS